jgi:GT2 family glycosyltransferase
LLPTLAVVVPATDNPPALGRCVAAVRASADPPEELLVIESATGPGPAAARNLGAAQATSDVLVFVDSDVVVHADALTRIRRALGDHPEWTGVFGSYDDTSPPGAVAHFRNLLHHHVHQQAPGPAETFWAGLGALRRDAFEGAGGFDSARYPRSSIEDIELGLRLRARGAVLVLDPAIQGAHLKAWTLDQMLATDFQRRGVPWVRLMLNGRSVPTTLNLGWRHRLSAGLAVLSVAALAARRLDVLAVLLGLFVSLNLPFYGLLARRGGLAGVASGVPLHIAHHLASAAAVPTGIALEAAAGWRRRRLARSPQAL